MWEIIMLAANSSQQNQQALAIADLTAGPGIDFSSDTLSGFIQHPMRFPIEYKRLRFWERAKLELTNPSNIGLTFAVEKYEKPGSILEITIPTRKEMHQFPAKVVAVKEIDQGFELGVWLLNEEDAPKLRIIEQICHIELYLNEKKYRDGPFVSQEKITEEWIGKFASQFPVN